MELGALCIPAGFGFHLPTEDKRKNNKKNTRLILCQNLIVTWKVAQTFKIVKDEESLFPVYGLKSELSLLHQDRRRHCFYRIVQWEIVPPGSIGHSVMVFFGSVKANKRECVKETCKIMAACSLVSSSPQYCSSHWFCSDMALEGALQHFFEQCLNGLAIEAYLMPRECHKRFL